MQRVTSTPRPNWQQTLQDTGFLHSVTKWREDAYYQLTKEQVAQLSVATTEVHLLAMQAVQHVVSTKAYDEVDIPLEWAPLIERSWRRRDPYIVSRLDFAYDGIQPPKLIEYNSDAPSLLIETGWFQKEWLVATQGDRPVDQAVALPEMLQARWADVYSGRHIHMTCDLNDKEALSNLIYMREMANNGGCTTNDIRLEDIGWDAQNKTFVNLENQKIDNLYKQYPWERILRGPWATRVLSEPTNMIEPAWKLVLSSKGILKILWRLFPNHPNLLAAGDNYLSVGRTYVKKPYWGGNGESVTIQHADRTERSAGAAQEGRYVYQGIAPIPNFNGRYPVVSSFLVGDVPSGIGVKEDGDMITSASASFVPHLVYGER